MRVTADVKEATKRKILKVSHELFRTTGFDATTTRDIAAAAEIAVGTLFNYFSTKEAVVIALATEALQRVPARPADQPAGSLNEALFELISSGLRVLKPYRNFLTPVLQLTLSPLTHSGTDEPLRVDHLEQVVSLGRVHGLGVTLTPVALQLYWTLYLGVLSYWVNDASPRQEDTLALLDQSLEMFVDWLNGSAQRRDSTGV